MKTLLRTSFLTAALALSVFAIGHSATSGTCLTPCYSSTTGVVTSIASWSTTQQECCSGTVNPCPAGSMPRGSSFRPTGGSLQRCAL